MKTPDARLGYLDALRGWAILGVMLVHTRCGGLSEQSATLQNLISNGARGVQLFYLISALTLFMSLDRKSIEQSYIRNFFLRRLFRISPLYWLIISWCFLTSPIVNLKSYLLHISYLNSVFPTQINNIIGVEWSVAIEFAFYLFVPFLFVKLKSLSITLWFLAGTIILANIGHVAYSSYLAHHPELASNYDWATFPAFWVPRHLPVFVMGFVAYHVIVKNARLKPSDYLLLSLFSGAALFSNFRYIQLDIVLPGIVFFGLTVAMSRRQFHLLENRITCYIGKISFSLYLLHLLAFGYVTPHLASLHCLPFSIRYPLAYLAGISVAVVLASLSYYLIEQPGIYAGKYLISVLDKRHENTGVS